MTEEQQVQEFLNQGDILAAERLLAQFPDKNARLLILQTLLKVFHVEAEQNAPESVFDKTVDIGELADMFIRLKLLLRRIEFDLPGQYQEELYPYCREHGVSQYLLMSILLTNIFAQEKVCRRLVSIFERAEGADSEKAWYFRQNLKYLKMTGEQAHE